MGFFAATEDIGDQVTEFEVNTSLDFGGYGAAGAEALPNLKNHEQNDEQNQQQKSNQGKMRGPKGEQAVSHKFSSPGRDLMLARKRAGFASYFLEVEAFSEE